MQTQAPERVTYKHHGLRQIRRQLAHRRTAEYVALAMPPVVALAMGYRQRWVAEDAFITLKVVDNILAGHGPVFNIDERVEVYTHPLWLATITAASVLGIRPEYAAVALGLGLSVLGIAAAQLGAARLISHLFGWPQSRRTIVLPVGMLVFVAIPVVWDFITSGLETGLIFAWLGISFWLLTRQAVPSETRCSRSLPVIEATTIGLGPLIRPDLALFSLAFLLVLLVLDAADRERRSATIRSFWLLLCCVCFAGAYQIFRMGYFAAVVPSPAIAKEAGNTSWDRGWAYFMDFTGTYHLWFPLCILLVGWVALLMKAMARNYKLVLVASVPVIAAIMHGSYVIRVGGDFMHGRLLLPALFGLLLPVAAVPLAIPDQKSLREAIPWLGVVLIVIWGLSCALFMRWPFHDADIRDGIPQGIVDERRFYVEQTGSSHPLTAADYRGTTFRWVEHGQAMRLFSMTNPRMVLTDIGSHPLGSHVDARIALVIYARSIGVQSHAVGDGVHIVDLHGLSDPIASRMKTTENDRSGHEKQLPQVWVLARYADLAKIAPRGENLHAAADTLACGEVSELIDAVESPMTVGRFVENVRRSWDLTELRIDPDPFVARAQLCGTAP